MDYLSLMKHRLSGKEKNIPGRIGNKTVVRNFASLIGINTPDIFQEGTIETLELKKLPDSFVLKPSFASTSIGVKLLKNNTSNEYFTDIISGEVLSWDDLKSFCLGISEKYYPSEPNRGVFIIEELLIDHDGNTPPQDIRFYCFQGKVGLILKEDHLNSSKVQAMYFNEDFLPFSDLSSRYGVAESAINLEEIVEPIVPKNWQKLLSVAKRISIAVPTPFARIDLYDTPKGIYLGEVTLTPGTFYYKNRKIMHLSESYRLGRMWLEAEKEMSGTKGFD